MVCRRMGLLDEAIREHLELKRLRGADPGLVAREESEALGLDRGAEALGADDPQGGFSSVGRETAELDMREVLEGREDTPSEPAAAGREKDRPSSIAGSPQAQSAAGDSLEWEMPGDGAPGDDDKHAEDDRHASGPDLHGEGTAAPSEELVEDVLEETPDFLRDTPEQERLWFEQQPPRDFDFDK